MSWDADSEPQGRASLTVEGLDIDWLSHRVRIVRIESSGKYGFGQVAVPTTGEHPVFTGVVTASPEEHAAATAQVSVSLVDTTGIPGGDMIPFYSGVPAGIDPLAQARVFLEDYGLPVVFPEVAVTLSAAITWQENTSNLTRVNDLLKAAGCTPLFSSPLGAFQADILRELDATPITAQFDAGRDLYLPQWSRNRDQYKVPNRVSGSIRLDGAADSTPAWVDLPATSRYSFEQTGQRVVKSMGDVDAADSDILTAILTRELESSQGAIEQRDITHKWIKGFRLGSVAEHTHHRVPVLRSRVIAQSVQMDSRGLVQSTLQGVS